MSEQYPNFRRLIAGLDIGGAIVDINRHRLVHVERNKQPDLWKEITVRQQYEGSAHVDTEMIVLRGPDTLDGILDNLDCIDFPATSLFPGTCALVGEVARFLKAREIGRIMLVRLSAGGSILPHVDEGAYARYYARFHLPIDSNPGCLFRCGEESVNMAPGELWWFNHQIVHSVLNRGGPRIHLIMDLTAPGFTGAIANIQVP